MSPLNLFFDNGLVSGNGRRIGRQLMGFLVAFYGTMLATLAGFVVAVGSARLLNAKGQRVLMGASALLLAGLGAGLFIVGVRGIWVA